MPIARGSLSDGLQSNPADLAADLDDVALRLDLPRFSLDQKLRPCRHDLLIAGPCKSARSSQHKPQRQRDGGGLSNIIKVSHDNFLFLLANDR